MQRQTLQPIRHHRDFLERFLQLGDLEVLLGIVLQQETRGVGVLALLWPEDMPPRLGIAVCDETVSDLHGCAALLGQRD